VRLREWHGSGFEPAVEYFGDASHGRFAGRVVGVRPDQLVDEWPVQVGHLDTEVLLELCDRSVDIGAGIVGVVAAPHGDRSAPETIARDRPVARAFEPFAERAITHVLGD